MCFIEISWWFHGYYMKLAFRSVANWKITVLYKTGK